MQSTCAYDHVSCIIIFKLIYKTFTLPTFYFIFSFFYCYFLTIVKKSSNALAK